MSFKATPRQAKKAIISHPRSGKVCQRFVLVGNAAIRALFVFPDLRVYNHGIKKTCDKSVPQSYSAKDFYLVVDFALVSMDKEPNAKDYRQHYEKDK